MCFSPQRRTIFRRLNFKKWSRTLSFLTFSLPNARFATAAYNFSTSKLQKVVPDPHFFNIFTCKCAFHHSGVQFLDIWTSKSPPGPSVFFNIFTCKCAFHHSGVQFLDIWTSKSPPGPSCFVHFHFKMCFSPQRRAIFDVSSQLRPPHPPL